MTNLEKFWIPLEDTKTYLGCVGVKYDTQWSCLIWGYLTVDELIEFMTDYQKHYPDAKIFEYREQQPN